MSYQKSQGGLSGSQHFFLHLMDPKHPRVRNASSFSKASSNGQDQASFSDNAVVDAIKLILLNYSNFSIAKILVKKIERVK